MKCKQIVAQAKLVHDLKGLRSTRSYTWLLLKYTENSVETSSMSSKEAQQITSFFSSINIYWLLRKESAETTNLIYFFSVYNREILTDSDGCENVT